MANKNNEICFLCGKRQAEVNQMVKGKFGYVCSDCVNEAYSVLNDDEQELNDNIQLATPSQIKEHLDQYVIGQDDAKRTLAVSVYNHYKRIRYRHKSEVEMWCL